MLLMRRRRSRALFRAGIFLLCLVAIVNILAPLAVRSYGGNPWEIWWVRISQLLRFCEEANSLGRIVQAEVAWQAIRVSPLLGYRWGNTFLQFQTETGINTLLLRGIFSTALITAMYLAVVWRAFRLWL